MIAGLQSKFICVNLLVDLSAYCDRFCGQTHSSPRQSAPILCGHPCSSFAERWSTNREVRIVQSDRLRGVSPPDRLRLLASLDRTMTATSLTQRDCAKPGLTPACSCRW